MRIALAAIFQMTNTFCRQLTPPEAFISVWTPDQKRQLRSCDPFGIGQLIDSIVVAGHDCDDTVVPLLAVAARSSGPLSARALELLAAQISTELGQASSWMDALILVLSGTMVDERLHSADLQIIRSARSMAPSGTPIVALFSGEANLSPRLVNSVDLALGFDATIDSPASATAAKTLALTRMSARHEIRPVSDLRRVPLLVSFAARQQASDAARILSELSGEFEADPRVLDVSLFPGFPYADVVESGFQILVTTNDDYDHAAELAQRLQASTWDLREAYDVSSANVEAVIHEAMLSEVSPVVIMDAGDDPGSGAPGDGTGLLWALVDLGAPNAALGVIVDLEAVEKSIAVGVGGSIKFDIGGSIDRRSGYPIQVAAVVRRISDGKLDIGGDCSIDVGRAVVLEVQGRHDGRTDLIVTEKAPQSIEPDLFRSLGIDVSTKQIIAVKSSGQTRQSFESISKRVLDTSTPGITTPALTYLDYERVRRPIFPLDSM